MRMKVKKALGIDISATSISMAWLKQDKHGVRLLKAARRAVPDGLLEQGMIESPKLFKKVVTDLTCKCGKPRVTTMSMFSSRSLLQILEVPEDVTLNTGQYVQNEIRHYVTLAGTKTVSDYRTLDSSEETKRVFVVAGEHKSVTKTVESCQATGLDVRGVEPSFLAYVRALYPEKLSKRYGCNVVLAILRDDQVCFSVWRDENLHFIRTHSTGEFSEDAEALGAFLATKLQLIMQYYDVQVSAGADQWEINVVTDDASSFPEPSRTRFCEGMGDIPVDVITSENLPTHTSIDMKHVSADQISIAAVGHALQVLSDDVHLPAVNLLPRQIREEKEVKKGLMLTAVAVAIVLLFMGLFSMALVTQIKGISTRIQTKKPKSSMGNVVKMRGEIESQIEQVGVIPTMLKQNLESQESVNWPAVLSDIKNRKPKGVCLTALDTRNNYEISIKGLALTYRDVTGYVNRLGQSANIAEAKQVKTTRKGGMRSHHVYEIKCQLKTTTGI